MARQSTLEDDQPDAAVLWRWVWAAVRPVLGYVFVVVGLLLLLTAYLGVSREVLVAKQLPYLVSGGLTGLAAVTLGSRLLLIEDLRRDSARLDRLERAVTELHTALLARPDVPEVMRTAAASNGHVAVANGHGAPEKLLTLTGGDSFHRQDCPVVQGKSGVKRTTAGAAQKQGLHACLLCQPLATGV
jgi:hypothetical protein